ncbi:MAG: hypothetical protein ACOC9Y_09050 [Chloroflexota bacterium]
MFFKRRKSRLERARERIQDLAETGTTEARGRVPTGRREDTEHLSFIGGLMLGLVIGVLVAVVLTSRRDGARIARKRQTGIQLLPREEEAAGEDNPAATG